MAFHQNGSLCDQYSLTQPTNQPGSAGFFHLVEETGLNPGLNRPGRNRFLPPEVEETGKNWKKVWNVWLSKYFPLQEDVNLKTNETAKNVLNINTLLLFTCSFHMGSESRNCDGFLEEIGFFHLKWKKLG